MSGAATVVVYVLAAGLLAWVVLGIVLALLVGQIIRRADRVADELARTRRAVVTTGQQSAVPPSEQPTHPRGPGKRRAETTEQPAVPR